MDPFKMEQGIGLPKVSVQVSSCCLILSKHPLSFGRRSRRVLRLRGV